MRNVLVTALAIVMFACDDKPEILIADGYFDEGKYREAIEIYSEFIQYNPHNMKALYNRGRSYEELGETDKALSDFTKVLDLDESHVQANISMAMNEYFRNKDFVSAKIYCDRALDKTGANKLVLTLRGKSKQKMGNLEEALKDYNAALSVDSEYAEAYFARGSLFFVQKRNSRACIDFVKAARLGLDEAKNAVKNYCE